MAAFIKKLRERLDFQSLSAASLEDIIVAEKKLKLKFSHEYIEYLLEFGVVSAGGHEFTGISRFPRLDVVSNTIDERKNNPKIPEDLYVVEKLNIDGIIVWQSYSGTVYLSKPKISPEKICNSLYEYIGNDY